MQLLTAQGYKDIDDCAAGEAVFAFDPVAGKRKTNNVRSLQWISREEYRASNKGHGVPFADYMPFDGYRVNGKWLLFQDQSVWRNGTQVVHATDLIVGDNVYNDDDDPVVIETIERVSELDGWWRFDVSGDHSYVVDGLTLHNASRFWVGGGSANTWAATSNTNWAATSGGSNNQTVPGTSDLPIFDSSSGTGNSVIGASITVQGLDCTGGTGSYAGTITHNTGVTLTINTGAASSLRFSAGMTYTPATTTSLITLAHTSGTANTTCAGQKLAALTINGVGGTTTLLDALLVNAVQNAVLTLTNGALDAGTNTAAISAATFTGTNSNTRTLTLGGTVTLGGNVTNQNILWNLSTTTGLTFNKNSANIVILAPTVSSVVTLTFDGGALTYNNLTANTSTNQYLLAINQVNTFANLALNSGVSLGLANNQTISNAFAWAGTQANPMLVTTLGSNPGTVTLTVTSGACTLKWGGLFGVNATGGATFTATDTFNFGQNTGWSITPPADSALTPAGIATAVWQDATAGDFTVAGSIAQQLWRGAAGSGTGVRGTVGNSSSTTSLPTSAFTLNGSAASGVVSNQFVGRNVLFDTNTTTAGLQGAVSAISASSASNTPTLTVATLPHAPTSGDTFSII
jgi:hypothetical protein